MKFYVREMLKRFLRRLFRVAGAEFSISLSHIDSKLNSFIETEQQIKTEILNLQNQNMNILHLIQLLNRNIIESITAGYTNNSDITVTRVGAQTENLLRNTSDLLSQLILNETAANANKININTENLNYIIQTQINDASAAIQLQVEESMYNLNSLLSKNIAAIDAQLTQSITTLDAQLTQSITTLDSQLTQSLATLSAQSVQIIDTVNLQLNNNLESLTNQINLATSHFTQTSAELNAITSNIVAKLDDTAIDLNMRIKEQNGSLENLTAATTQNGLKINTVKQLTSRILLTSNFKSKKIRVLFLIHAADFWYALRPLIEKTITDDEFEPLIVSIPGKLVGDKFENTTSEFLESQFDKVYKFLDVKDIPENFIDLINPDLIFKQTPWENQYPEVFQFQNLIGRRVCYIPYGIHTTNTGPAFFDLQHLAMCWRIYCVNDVQLQYYGDYNLLKGLNAKVSGYPKFEFLLQNLSFDEDLDFEVASTDAKLTQSLQKFKIVWAPHYSSTDWLGFSTFEQYFLDYLDFAKQNPDIEIILRPHPALFDSITMYNRVAKEEFDDFLSEFQSLPNCSIYRGPNYIEIFNSSDLLVTDGVGFLWEYLMTEKPIIHTDSRKSVGFLPFYQELLPAFYKAFSFEDVKNHIRNLRAGNDPLKETRHLAKDKLYPKNIKQSPSQFIIDDIKTSVRENLL